MVGRTIPAQSLWNYVVNRNFNCRKRIVGGNSCLRPISFSATSPAAASPQDRVTATQKWFESVVLKQKLCPFTFSLIPNNALRIVASDADSTKTAVQSVREEIQYLMEDPDNTHETTLVVFDHSHSYVREFRDFVRLSWELQDQAIGEKYLSKLQLVLFHPKATHQTYGEALEDNPADYTIRSPYPTVHLLREEDVLRAVESGYPNLESLPSRNQKKLLDQGLEACQKRLHDCYNAKST
jgi:uncharacterized protein